MSKIRFNLYRAFIVFGVCAVLALISVVSAPQAAAQNDPIYNVPFHRTLTVSSSATSGTVAIQAPRGYDEISELRVLVPQLGASATTPTLCLGYSTTTSSVDYIYFKTSSLTASAETQVVDSRTQKPLDIGNPEGSYTMRFIIEHAGSGIAADRTYLIYGVFSSSIGRR